VLSGIVVQFKVSTAQVQRYTPLCCLIVTVPSCCIYPPLCCCIAFGSCYLRAAVWMMFVG